MYPGTSGLQLQLYPLWARSHALSSPHTCTSKKGAQAHRGICVTGYTHFFSAGAWSCCRFGEKRRGAPGVWPLLSSPLPDSSQFSSPLVSQSCYPPPPPPPPMTLHPSSLFLLPRNLPARSPPILTQNAVACHYLSCASSELQAHLTCSLFFAPSPYAAIFSRLAAPTQMSQSLLQLNRNLIMRRASPLGKLDERSKSFFDTVSLCRRAGPQIFIRIMWLLYLCVVQVSISSHLAHTCSSLCIKAPKSARHLNYVLLSLCCQSLLKSGVCSLTPREGFRTFSLLAMLFLLHVQAFVCFLTCVAGVPAPEGMNERMTFCCCLTFI